MLCTYSSVCSYVRISVVRSALISGILAVLWSLVPSLFLFVFSLLVIWVVVSIFMYFVIYILMFFVL